MRCVARVILGRRRSSTVTDWQDLLAERARQTECLTGQQAGSGRDIVAVGFADHEIREYSVGSSPGGGDIRRSMLAQAALKRPQQRLAYRCIVGRLDAVFDVAFGERAYLRQHGF